MTPARVVVPPGDCASAHAGVVEWREYPPKGDRWLVRRCVECGRVERASAPPTQAWGGA